MAGGCADGPGLHVSFPKQGVDQCSQHVDGSSDVKNRLPFLKGVLGIAEGETEDAGLSVTNSEMKWEPLFSTWC